VTAPPVSKVTTEHGFRAHLPLPRERRRGLALAFSGGGYRAALFHLGSVRRLSELGVLSRADTVTSVSGGSIMTAQLATYRRRLGDDWPAAGEPLPRFDEWMAEPLRAFTRTNIRTRTILRRLRPRHWFDSNTPSSALAERYAAGPAPGTLGDLPEHPRFVLLATDVTHRAQWLFDAGRRLVGNEEAGLLPGAGWPLARAAAASSCLPGAFTAMSVDHDGRSVDLTDGGIYDNLGLEPVWRDHETVLVSDAAPSFTAVPAIVPPIWRALRYAVTLLEQATDVRKRWLISSFVRGELEGAYWGIASHPASYELEGAGGYSAELIDGTISQVRIDLDVFSDAEIAVLENHGYLMADVAVRRHAPGLMRPGAPDPRPPHPDWLDEARAAEALADSHRTHLFRRGL
jgi:NTE family protein